MISIFVIHGAYGNPEENWFPWLKFELEKLNNRVFVPKFPTPENQSLENWLKVFDEYKENLNEDSIVIGHSLGPAFLLNVIENLNKPIKAAFFVSGFLELLGNSDFDSINKTFIDRKFDWQKIKRNSSNFFVFHSDNDPYIPLEQAEKLAKNLGINPIIVKNAGHFNEKAGYSKFNLILEKIKPLL
jgi:uncharacterized protein